MEAKVSRGHLEVHDKKGSYRIPIGRRSRKCMMILDRKEGEYIRSLEIDLFTGFVYYCVDNATSGGLSYYYDMSSKKVGHYFIHRYLRLARNHGFTATPEEYEIFEKLPCADWVEEMEKLPGWKEAIDNRLENLLLPEAEPVQISAGDFAEEAGGDAARKGEESEKMQGFLSGVVSVSFFRAPSGFTGKEKEYLYIFKESGGEKLLLHRNETIGNAFFGEDVEFERILSDKEYVWLTALTCAAAASGQNPSDASGAVPVKEIMTCADQVLTEDVRAALFPQGQELVLQKAVIRMQDGGSIEISSDEPAQLHRAEILQTAIQGLLRREIELI